MLVVWTPKRPPWGRCALILRSCNTLVCLRLCQPSWAPWMRDRPRSVCFCKPCQPALGTKDFTSGMKASPWGARLMVLPSASGCLGTIHLRPSLGRHASGGSARLLATIQDIWVSIHSKRSRSMTSLLTASNHYRRPLHTTYLSRPCWVSSDTRYWWFEASLRSAHLQGLLEVSPARLLAAMLGDLGVSTLCSIKTMT
jgi:hypothetical protein